MRILINSLTNKSSGHLTYCGPESDEYVLSEWCGRKPEITERCEKARVVQ